MPTTGKTRAAFFLGGILLGVGLYYGRGLLHDPPPRPPVTHGEVSLPTTHEQSTTKKAALVEDPLDHTTKEIPDLESFRALATEENGREVVKLTITDFADPEKRTTYYMNSKFYSLHDEWYWFKLL